MSGSSSTLRPGWPEIFVGLFCIATFGIGVAIGLVKLGINPVALGIILTALSGVAGMSGFFAAYLLRIRSWAAFGVRSTSWRWIMIGAAVGVVAFIAKTVSIVAYVSLTGDSRTIQDVYATGGSGGPLSLLAATFFLSVVTPIGEEFLFRGVITTALLRYGPLVGVVGGAIIFAVFHGVNMIFPAALVVGLPAGEVFRPSGSIWPAVTLHSVVNLPTVPVMVLANLGQ